MNIIHQEYLKYYYSRHVVEQGGYKVTVLFYRTKGEARKYVSSCEGIYCRGWMSTEIISKDLELSLEVIVNEIINELK